MNQPIFPTSPTQVSQILSGLFKASDSVLAGILARSVATIEYDYYDNRSPGSHCFTLHLAVPLELFTQLDGRVGGAESMILAKARSALRNPGNCVVDRVVLAATVEPVAVNPTADDIGRIWGKAPFRLFISHLTADKVGAVHLKTSLSKYGFAAFVAHEDIQPSTKWLSEIRLALNSMHGLVALLTPNFHASLWTDQEVGAAHGRQVPIVAVRLGLDPYGFMGDDQGLSGRLDHPDLLALKIVSILLTKPECVEVAKETLVWGLETALNFEAAKMVAAQIAGISGWSESQLFKIATALNANSQVSEAYGVPSRLRELFVREGFQA